MAKTIVALSVEEGELFEIYVMGPNPCAADPAAEIGSKRYLFQVHNGEVVPAKTIWEEGVTTILYTSLDQTKELHKKEYGY